MPIQEYAVKQCQTVTYRDNAGNMPEILLPNWEIKQAEFRPGPDNSFHLRREQDWEGHRCQKRLGDAPPTPLRLCYLRFRISNFTCARLETRAIQNFPRQSTS